MENAITFQTFAGSSAAGGLYKNKKTGLSVPLYKKKQIKELYPAGGFSVRGQIGTGKNEIGALVTQEGKEAVYQISKMPHTVITGYVQVGENEFLAVVKDVLLFWIFGIVLLAALCAALAFIIKDAVPANTDTDEPVQPSAGVIDPNAQLGEGQISVPDKTDTKGKQIKINGIAEMKLKAGQTDQSFVFSNPEENPCYFIIEIEMADSGEILYTSQLLPPGYSISQFALNRALDAGEYNVVVHFKTFSFDKEQRALNNMDIKTKIKAS